MMQGGNISASHARALLDVINDQHHDAVAFCAEDGIDFESLKTAKEICGVVFGRMYQRAILLLDDESLGMVSGGKVPSGTFRVMCLCVIHRSTLASIVQRAGEFLDVCNGIVVKPELQPASHSVCISIAKVRDVSEQRFDEVLQSEGVIKVRTTLYLWHSLLCWFAGRYLPLVSVEFGFPEPANGARWAQLFRCPVLFDAQQSVLRFDPDSMQLPNVQSEASLSVFLKTAPIRLVMPTYHEQSVSDRVVAVFGDDYSRTLPDAAQVGDRLNMSVSTLRRQLREEGTSFQRLKDDCLRAAAMEYLASSELTFAEVAELLGFLETSAFYRSFKRWTGETPSQYRESLKFVPSNSTEE